MARRHLLLGLVVTLLGTAMTPNDASATGLLVPSDRSVNPLGIVYQRIDVEIKDQAAVTKVEQQFRNHTSRQLEAYYLFPLPAGAGVQNFSMWINGRETKAELVEADKARRIYEDIVRRMKDPGLLEHMGGNLWRVRVFPIAPRGLQKIEISYSEVVRRDGGVAEYVYPLKTGNRSVQTEKDFSVHLNLRSSAELKSVYSPSHDVDVTRRGDHKAIVGFEANHYPLNRNFHLFWTVSDKDVGLSMLAHRESPGDDGFFMMLVSPQVEHANEQRVPRDLVFVVDTSGSMRGEKIEQARRSLTYCLEGLHADDRFGVIDFSTTVREYKETLQDANKDNVKRAVKWVKDLEASGGTAIHDALLAALDMRSGRSRNFTIVFLTDGLPTIGETDPKAIVRSVEKRNSAETRMFVFGVGDDVNTHLLDQLADRTRAASVYVRPKEDLELKVSNFYDKISHPVLANLKLKLQDDDVRIKEMYPPALPDLFHGGQLIVIGRYKGSGSTAIRLTGKLGGERKEYIYETKFPGEKQGNDFLPGLWARRKVGYLLDQIRLNGEKRELVKEVVHLAKRYGIVTPYTSYLVVPDESPTVARERLRRDFQLGGRRYSAVRTPSPTATPEDPSQSGEQRLGQVVRGLRRADVDENARNAQSRAAGQSLASGSEAKKREGGASARKPIAPKLIADSLGATNKYYFGKQSGKEAVDVAQALGALKNAEGEASFAVRQIGKKTFVNVQGVWVDQEYKAEQKLIKVKYLSDAYFQILRAAPQAKSILALGEQIVWVVPSGQALAIDIAGKEKLSGDEAEALFTSKGK